ncbi:MAG: 5'-methylthioadenosine/S-adenosylhomocysteine nucleosidase [Deltaproteobacteria bacterium]|nr:5'-methylthioadenosine/S-adenosylhomocysteine nucleosidase [Deltaproteobacteria bacterium]
MNSEMRALCFVFPMGIEAAPFLERVEVRREWSSGKAWRREAFFEGRHLLIVKCGVGPERAAACVRALLERPSAILCVGTSGALAPELALHDLIISSETVDAARPDLVLSSSEFLVHRLADAVAHVGLRHRIGRLATSNEAVFHPRQRELLHRSTGAHAVDMESHSIAVEARKLDVPFASLRVISDHVDSPPLPDPAVFRGLWRSPRRLPSNLLGALRWRAFIRNFRRSVRILPPVLVRFMREWRRSPEGP